MKNSFWNTAGTLEPVETSSGGKVHDYFGLHNVDKAKISEFTHVYSGDKANLRLNTIVQERLNNGKSFDGALLPVTIKHINGYVFRHQTMGLCLYIDESNSRPRDTTEIYNISDGVLCKHTLDTGSFFENILNEELEQSSVEQLCMFYRRKYIEMIDD